MYSAEGLYRMSTIP